MAVSLQSLKTTLCQILNNIFFTFSTLECNVDGKIQNEIFTYASYLLEVKIAILSSLNIDKKNKSWSFNSNRRRKKG